MSYLLSVIDKEAVSYGGIVTVYLLAIVFAVLALLIVVLVFGNKILNLIQRCVANIKNKFKARRSEAKEDSPSSVDVLPAPTVQQEGFDGEEVAAVMAAISIVLQGQPKSKKTKFVVRKIERI